MDINQAFKDTLKNQQKATAPRSFLLKVERDAVFSPSDPNVFKVVGTRVDTNERVAVVSVKSSSGQFVPKAGDVMRADKAARDPANPNAPMFRAPYFHTYDQGGFCLNAVMQPLPIRTTPGTSMISANVLAYDPKSSGTILSGADVANKLSATILSHLKQWQVSEPSGITHDVQGRSIWDGKPTRGLTPIAVVRFAEQSFKVYGAGAMAIDPADKAKGERFPSDQELLERIDRTKGVITLKSVIQSLVNQGATAEQLSKVDISIVPGVAITVGYDQLKNRKSGEEYYAVPQAYGVPKEGGGTFAGHRDSYIHVKMTRTGKLAVTDTAPVPGGRPSARVPLFANEVAQIEARKNMAAGVSNAPAAAPAQGRVNREQALQMNDFPLDDDLAQAPANAQPQQQVRHQVEQQPQRQAQQTQQADYQQAPSQAPVQSTQAHDNFDAADYDFDDLEEDMHAIEQLSQGLGSFDEVDSLLKEAEAISAQRNSPRMG